MTAAATIAEAPVLATVSDYLGLTTEQRYGVVSHHFPSWLLTEPIEFPPHHSTYGWACRVDGCDAGLRPTDTRLLCSEHAKQCSSLKEAADLDEFVRVAEASAAQRLGWALSHKLDCGICGSKREAQQLGYCQRNAETLRAARRQGISETKWRPPNVHCRLSANARSRDASTTASSTHASAPKFAVYAEGIFVNGNTG